MEVETGRYEPGGVLINPGDPHSRWQRANVDPQATGTAAVCYPNRGCMTEHLLGLACAAPSACLLSTGFGAVITSTTSQPAQMDWARTTIYGPPHPIPPTYQIVSPVCFSASLCYALGSHGDLLASTAPFAAEPPSWSTLRIAGFKSAGTMSCPSQRVCFALGTTGVAGAGGAQLAVGRMTFQ